MSNRIKNVLSMPPIHQFVERLTSNTLCRRCHPLPHPPSFFFFFLVAPILITQGEGRGRERAGARAKHERGEEGPEAQGADGLVGQGKRRVRWK